MLLFSHPAIRKYIHLDKIIYKTFIHSDNRKYLWTGNNPNNFKRIYRAVLIREATIRYDAEERRIYLSVFK